MKLNMQSVMIAVAISAAIIFGTRAFPFILFSKKEPPAIIKFIEKYIPPMIIAILVVYGVKDINVTAFPYGIPYFIALASAVMLHLWKNNPMLSIFGSTILFMILQKLW
ncbi:AzlD domain-containing protein [Treponema parvum]|uniref:AzlD domain-containing protein n=1 Tax=Treponema parvum TaxID=138851 RepID=A0A975IE02_9SPIR|nr:AzlD domain-containing protein [Treponema parvum]QTQ13441.1 AzlD domain-containing protein [Treponema parvum]